MRINKDLAEATMMLACIVLVLIGTTDFNSENQKLIVMISLGIVAVISGILRFFGGKKEENKQDETYN